MNYLNRKVKAVLLGTVALLALGTMSACAEIAAPDAVGLWYAQGQVDGNKFDHCVKPGTTDETTWNDSVYWVPNNLRTWNVAPSGGDTTNPLVVTARPDTGQQSGLEVNVWPQVNFALNTYCGDNDKDPNSPLVQWWQKLGDRYDADTDEGWVRMLNNTVVPALEKAKNVLRAYTADELVLGSVWADAEKQFGETFSTELERLSGGDFFCGPNFVRTNPTCSPVQVSIKDVDYRDAGIQAARNDKQKAVEQAAAQVAAARGAVEAAEAQKALYGNAAWMQLEIARIELEKAKVMAEACKSAGARCIIGDAGNVLVQQ
jgi:hypothetical protein